MTASRLYTTEPIEDSGDVAGFKSAVGQDKHQRRPTLLSASVTVVNTARDLGVILDSQLSLDAHVASACLQEQLLPTEAASSSRTVTVC